MAAKAEFHEAPASDDDYLSPVCEFIPAWFAARMATDTWVFGVLLTTGQVLAVEGIDSVTRDASGGLWIDFRLIEKRHVDLSEQCSFGPLVYSPTTRTNVSVNARQVVAAFELADT